MSKSRKSSRLARKGGAFRHTIHDDVKEEEECIQLGQNGKPVDEIDILMEKTKSKFPICPTLNKRVNQHNIADLPSLNDEIDNQETVSSQSNSETPDVIQRRARAKANNLIEAKNRFRSLLQKTHLKNNPEMQAQYELEKKTSGLQAPEAPRTRLQAQSSIKAAGPPPKKQLVHFRIGGPKRINFTPLLPRPGDDRPDDESTANFHRAIAQYGYSRYSLIPELKPKKRQDVPEIDNDPDGPYSSEALDIWHLPPPDPGQVDPKTGKPINLLIPKRVREFERPTLDIAANIQSMDDKPTDRLRNEYKLYFEASAQEFRDAYQEENSRFRHAFKVLESMYETTKKKINGESVFESTPYEEESDLEEDYNKEITNISQLEDQSVIETLKTSSSSKEGQTKVFRLNDMDATTTKQQSNNDNDNDQQTQSSSSASQIGNDDSNDYNNRANMNNMNNNTKKFSIDLDYSSEQDNECVEISSDNDDVQAEY